MALFARAEAEYREAKEAKAAANPDPFPDPVEAIKKEIREAKTRPPPEDEEDKCPAYSVNRRLANCQEIIQGDKRVRITIFPQGAKMALGMLN